MPNDDTNTPFRFGIPDTPEPRWSEADRLAALHRYGILDTPAELVFDDFTRMAAEICETPIAVVNLIDAGRQWFKSEIGLGVRETPLDISICVRAILQPGPMVVPDTRLDPRFAGNPLVAGEPGLRFYAGAPLRTEDGLPIGTICVLDHAPRPDGLTARQIAALEAFSRQIMAQLELRLALRLRTEERAEKERMLREQELLMQEVHHRVRNSLQLVQNLLSLQSRAAAHPEVSEQLQQSAARIRTIGMIHDRLYRADSSGLDVDIQPYLDGLIDDLRDALASAVDGRALRLSCDAVRWPAVDVPTLGLVATELVTNALKYGRGEVRVTFRQPPGGQPVLSVEDEGSGLPPGFDPGAGRGLGMRIVTGLLRGPGAGLEVDRLAGHTRFVARLPHAAADQGPAGT